MARLDDARRVSIGRGVTSQRCGHRSSWSDATGGEVSTCTVQPQDLQSRATGSVLDFGAAAFLSSVENGTARAAETAMTGSPGRTAGESVAGCQASAAMTDKPVKPWLEFRLGTWVHPGSLACSCVGLQAGTLHTPSGVGAATLSTTLDSAE